MKRGERLQLGTELFNGIPGAAPHLLQLLALLSTTRHETIYIALELLSRLMKAPHAELLVLVCLRSVHWQRRPGLLQGAQALAQRNQAVALLRGVRQGAGDLCAPNLGLAVQHHARFRHGLGDGLRDTGVRPQVSPGTLLFQRSLPLVLQLPAQLPEALLKQHLHLWHTAPLRSFATLDAMLWDKVRLHSRSQARAGTTRLHGALLGAQGCVLESALFLHKDGDARLEVAINERLGLCQQALQASLHGLRDLAQARKLPAAELLPSLELLEDRGVAHPLLQQLCR
mmetsp:Transcript_117152/g.250335  ORF Transcript_117152/g.250335 Transcript_117152/m.250335 type:complete len:285 (-) Transcript_117152:89-943(-)